MMLGQRSPTSVGSHHINITKKKRGHMIGVRVLRIVRLLASGYSTEESQRRHELSQDWARFHEVLLKKLENVGIVSGLLLTAGASLLASGELRRVTFASVAASIFLSAVSLVCYVLCLWSLIGVTPLQLKSVVTKTTLFYYLHSTPSLFGGAAALAFFIAVGAWTWLDATDGYGWTPRVMSVLLGGALVANTGLCFFLGASSW